MWSDTLLSVILAELTVPWEANIEWAHEMKATKYHDLKNQIEDNGWKCRVYPVEVGCRGFVGQSTVKFLDAIGVAPCIKQATIRKLQETAETASAWIWNSRDRMKTDRTWHDSHAHHHPPGSATAVLLGPPIHTTPTGIGPERRYGFQLKMVGDEQVRPCMSDITT